MRVVTVVVVLYPAPQHRTEQSGNLAIITGVVLNKGRVQV